MVCPAPLTGPGHPAAGAPVRARAHPTQCGGAEEPSVRRGSMSARRLIECFRVSRRGSRMHIVVRILRKLTGGAPSTIGPVFRSQPRRPEAWGRVAPAASPGRCRSDARRLPARGDERNAPRRLARSAGPRGAPRAARRGRGARPEPRGRGPSGHGGPRVGAGRSSCLRYRRPAGPGRGQAVAAVNDGAQIILGPVFADSVRAVRAAVGSSGVTVLAFSNNPSVAGGNVFILGNTFDTAARRLATHAARQGKGRILVVHERTEAGVLGRTAIERAVASTRSGLAGSVAFDFSQQGVVGAVPRISETARASGADAVFFTSNTAGALPMLLELLPQNGAGPGRYQYIGLTRWDIPAEALALPGAQGAWFAMPDPGLAARFDARYRSAYGRAPHPIAGLAYDGIRDRRVRVLGPAGRARSCRPDPEFRLLGRDRHLPPDARRHQRAQPGRGADPRRTGGHRRPRAARLHRSGVLSHAARQGANPDAEISGPPLRWGNVPCLGCRGHSGGNPR
jgi:hypothetical protein